MSPHPTPPPQSTYLERTTFPESGHAGNRRFSHVERFVRPETIYGSPTPSIDATSTGSARRPLNEKGQGMNTKLGTTDLDEATANAEATAETKDKMMAVAEKVKLDEKPKASEPTATETQEE